MNVPEKLCAQGALTFSFASTRFALTMFAFTTFGFTLMLTGCKPDAAVQKGAVVGAGPNALKTDPAPDAATLGTVMGTVQFTGAPPARVRIDMSQDPACGLTGGTNLAEQYVVERGKLANVFVYVKDAPHYNVPMQPVVVDQKGCRFEPHVAAIAAGGSVEFRNSDPTMHNVHSMAVQAGNRSVDISQGPGAKPQDLTFREAETMVPVRCNNHPWMNAFLNVSPNTFFAVTGTDGQFQIPGLPAGNYTLAFVHEKLGEKDVPITVKALGRTPVTVAFSSN